MSCLNTRYKLVTLCCCAILIAVISGVMVINAFLNSSGDSSDSYQTILKINPVSTTALLDVNGMGLLKPSQGDGALIPEEGGLDIQIKINEITTPSSNEITTPSSNEITTPSSKITETKRKWFELQKYNTNQMRPVDIGVIDIDTDTVNEISGSGMEDSENGDDAFIPLVQQSTPILVRGDNFKNLGHSSTLTHTLPNKLLTKAPRSNRPADHLQKKPSNNIGDQSNMSPGTSEASILTERPYSTRTHTGSHGAVKDFRYHIGSPVTQPNLSDKDKCEVWLRCEDPFLKNYTKKFALLPTCPCTYPLKVGDSVYDAYHKKIFKWKDSEYTSSYLYAYHKGAMRCIRSEVGRGTLAAQNCCYDKHNLLLTRGSGAGTPDLISKDVSSALHQLVDQVPWILCKGDWTRYNIARPPNNLQGCRENPPQMEYLYQVWLAKNYL